jgi:hypothetical protein
MKIHLSSDVHMLDTLLIVRSRNAALGALMMKLQSNERRNSKRGMETTLIIRGTKPVTSKNYSIDEVRSDIRNKQTHNGIDEVEVRTQMSDRRGETSTLMRKSLRVKERQEFRL